MNSQKLYFSEDIQKCLLEEIDSISDTLMSRIDNNWTIINKKLDVDNTRMSNKSINILRDLENKEKKTTIENSLDDNYTNYMWLSKIDECILSYPFEKTLKKKYEVMFTLVKNTTSNTKKILGKLIEQNNRWITGKYVNKSTANLNVYTLCSLDIRYKMKNDIVVWLNKDKDHINIKLTPKEKESAKLTFEYFIESCPKHLRNELAEKYKKKIENSK